jgi:hypothetical protein
LTPIVGAGGGQPFDQADRVADETAQVFLLTPFVVVLVGGAVSLWGRRKPPSSTGRARWKPKASRRTLYARLLVVGVAGD